MKTNLACLVMLLVIAPVPHAAADDPPASFSKVTYSGTLDNASGSPLTGEHNIEVKLFQIAADGMPAMDALCSTGSQAIALTAGRFSIPLPEPCVQAVGTRASVEVEVMVDGASLGRTALAGVPYALQAKNAQHAEVATNADHATIADSTPKATHANTADKATSADTAAVSERATNADKAKQADSATRAIMCESAANANEAKHAQVADRAAEANHTPVADRADVARVLVGEGDDGSHSFYARWNGAGALQFWIDSTNVKNFIIAHPTDPARYLVHTTLEGPENAVFYRGSARLHQGRAEVQLPAYFEAATRPEGRTVQLTPKFSDEDESISTLAASAVENGKFRVRATDRNNPRQTFDWEVKAVRADVAPLLVEPTHNEIQVHGEGPYKYYSINPAAP